MSKDIFKLMVKMQHSLNIQTMGEDYLEKNINWNSAIIVESGKLLDALGYKWWKKQEPDMENVKAEAIDLLHFVISEHIQEKGIKKCILLFRYWFEDDDMESHLKEYKDDNIENLMGLFTRTMDLKFLYLKAIFHKLDMSNEDVYIAYIERDMYFLENYNFFKQ